MMGYGYNITIDDRWRIVMYVRALQRSEDASLQDASPDEQQQLQSGAKPAGSAMNSARTNWKLTFNEHTMRDYPKLENRSFYDPKLDPRVQWFEESP